MTMPAGAAFTRTAPQENLRRYLSEIHRFPMLDAEEEADLGRRCRQHVDPAAEAKLITSHLRLVVRVAVGYRGYGLPLGEIVAEGNLGLIRAARRFDPERGHRFSTYALWWIRAAIQEYVLHSWSMVKIGTTAAQKKLFFNLRRLKQGFSRLEDGDLPAEVVNRISVDLKVPVHEVINMNRRLSAPDHSLNAPLAGDAQWQDTLATPQPDPETQAADRETRRTLHAALEAGLGTLSPREQDIIRHRRLRDQPATLEELSQRHGISRERVRQIEGRAFEKLRQQVLNSLPEGVIPADRRTDLPKKGRPESPRGT